MGSGEILRDAHPALLHAQQSIVGGFHLFAVQPGLVQGLEQALELDDAFPGLARLAVDLAGQGLDALRQQLRFGDLALDAVALLPHQGGDARAAVSAGDRVDEALQARDGDGMVGVVELIPAAFEGLGILEDAPDLFVQFDGEIGVGLAVEGAVFLLNGLEGFDLHAERV